MKKGIIIAIVILLIIIILAVLIFGFNKEGSNINLDGNSQQNIEEQEESKEEKIKKYNQSFGSKIGTDSDTRNGNSVKSLVSKIMDQNRESTNMDDLIVLHFESWKGSADSNGSEESTQRIYECIGDEYSTYQIIVDEYTEEGKIKKLTIKWLDGTSSEPDIPAEISDEFDDYDFYDGDDDNSNISYDYNGAE